MSQGIDYYQAIKEDEDLSSFVKTHGPLIKRIAYHLKAKLSTLIELDDLIQAGLIGLLEAKKHFSPDKKASFDTYAGIKIRGAMIDELRKNTGMTKDLSQNIKNIAQARMAIERETAKNTPILAKDLAEKLGISLQRYINIMAEINTHKAINQGGSSFDSENYLEDIPDPDLADPIDVLEKDKTVGQIKAWLLALPKREQQILALHYNEQLTFKEIANILNLTEARISQLHALALSKIRKKSVCLI